MAKTWRKRRELAKLKAVPAVAKEAATMPGGSFADHVDARPSLLNFLEASLVPIPANAAALVANFGNMSAEAIYGKSRYRRPGQLMSIPPVMTPVRLGDATGYTTPNRDWVYGYDSTVPGVVGLTWVNKRYEKETRVRTVRNYEIGDTSMSVDVFFHPLGASYELDVGCRSLNPWRMAYGAVATADHRARVAWAGGGDVCVCDDVEGWDAVFVNCGTDDAAAHLYRWRGGPRVWVSFGRPWDIDRTQERWSGAAGFHGEPHKMFCQEVLTGNMPSRAFLEWLCENFRLPDVVAPYARRCNFYTEKNPV